MDDKEFNNFLGCVGVHQRDEVAVFGEAIDVLPPEEGSPSTKSREISSHTCDGIGSGWRRPAGDRASLLFLWQTSQVATWRWTSVFIPSQ